MGITSNTSIFYQKRILLGLLILILNFTLKSYKIEKGDSVVWDEAHFGKFASRYLKREFYFDVHPPLGKMMTALSGYIFKQDPSFKFESGTEYPKNMDYVGMRRFHAFIASFLPVFVYGIHLQLGYDLHKSFLMSLLYVFENGFCSISRLILLDSHLIFFTGSTAYLLTRFYADSQTRKKELINLALLGMSIGCVMSVKWIGCLTTLMVGIFIIFQLLRILLSKQKITKFLYNFFVRAVLLIFLPIMIYLLWFLVHFQICNTSTTDEAHMSSLFQVKLKNGSLGKVRKFVSFGSIVTIKSSKNAGGNLHSHFHNYPNSTHKQITTYFHKDENNHWAFQKVIDAPEDADFLCANDEVVLYHVSTKIYLSGDSAKAHVSKGGRVIGIGEQILQSCIWVVEVVKDELKLDKKVKTITTKFRLRNKEGNCYLNSSGKHYPQWGFSQGEVTCTEDMGEGTIWNVEENKLIEDDNNEEYTEIRDMKSTFLKHVVELNQAMYNTNKSLTQEKNLEPAKIVSRPYEWFILRRGLRMNGWDDDKYKFYMFGNPFIWYFSTLAIILSPIILLGKTIYKKRNDLKPSKNEYFIVFLSFIGWFIHYMPFFLIGRVLYFHHYFPALFFAILSIGYLLNHLPIRFLELTVVLAIVCYFYFMDLTYGIEGSANSLLHKRWIPTWDFV